MKAKWLYENVDCIIIFYTCVWIVPLLPSCRKNFKPTAEYFELKETNNIYHSSSIKIDPNSRYCLVISNKIGHSENKLNSNKLKIVWNSENGQNIKYLDSDKEIQCSWAPAYSGERDDVALKIDFFTGNGTLNIYDVKKFYTECKGVWILKTTQ